MGLQPPLIVEPPPFAPPRISLLSAAQAAGVAGPPAGVDQHWQGGVTFRRRLCGDPELTWDCVGDGGEQPAAKDITADDDAVSVWRPYWPWVGDRCTALQWTAEERGTRARELLESRTSAEIGRELWRGDAAQAAALENNWLANPASVVDLTPASGSSPLVYALAALQTALADQPGRGMIHATLGTVTQWAGAYVIRREGNVWLDAFDNFVVADDGYDGSDPNGDVDTTGETAWAYATGIVPVWVGPVRVVPDEADDEMQRLAAALDREENTIEWRVERPTLAMFDGCVHVGINVDLCSPCCVPSE